MLIEMCRRRACPRVWLGGLVLGLLASSVVGDQKYAVLRVIGGYESYFKSINLNDASHIVGIRGQYSADDQAVFWSEERGFVTLCPDWEGSSTPYGINNSDVIVGTLQPPGPPSQHVAFIYRDGAWAKLDSLLPPNSGWMLFDAFDINESGQIVGRGNRGGFLMTPGTPYYDIVNLDALTRKTTYPAALNNHGDVVGRAVVGFDDHPFLLRGGVFYDLGTLGGHKGTATDINDAGQVVGYAQTIDGETYGKAFLWQNGVMQNLGTLGGENSYAYRINNDGLVFGGAQSQLAWGGEACLWRNGSIRPLQPQLPVGVDARLVFERSGLNNAGQLTMSDSSTSYAGTILLWPLRKSITSMDVKVLRGSTVEAAFDTRLPESAQFSVSLDGADHELVTVDRSGAALARWLNQSDGHSVCVDGDEDSCLPVQCAPRPDTYVVAELPPLPLGEECMVYDINNHGDGVGNSDNWYELYDDHAALWTGARVVDLGTLGGGYSWARGCNEAGWIVGEAETGSGVFHACLWRDGQILDLFEGSTRHSFAVAINDVGEITGSADLDAETTVYTWRNGQVEFLPPMDNTRHFIASDINNRAEIVGTWMDSSYRFHAVRWSERSGYIDLEGSDESDWVRAINDNGISVGETWDATHKLYQVAVWDPHGHATLLASLPGYSAGAYDISAGGDIVGIETNDDVQKGALWRGGEHHTLDDLVQVGCAWDSIIDARSINDVGQIVGRALRGANLDAVLLTPAYAGNIRSFSARCKRNDLVVRVNTWLPAGTTLTAQADNGARDCLSIDEHGRAKVRLSGGAAATSVCLADYADLCAEVVCR